MSHKANNCVLKVLKKSMSFNELCRTLDSIHGRKEIAIALIELEEEGKVKSNLIQSSFETDKRWIRIYWVVKKKGGKSGG